MLPDRGACQSRSLNGARRLTRGLDQESAQTRNRAGEPSGAVVLERAPVDQVVQIFFRPHARRQAPSACGARAFLDDAKRLDIVEPVFGNRFHHRGKQQAGGEHFGAAPRPVGVQTAFLRPGQNRLFVNGSQNAARYKQTVGQRAHPVAQMLGPAVRQFLQQGSPARCLDLGRFDPEAFEHRLHGLCRLAGLQASQHVNGPDRQPGNAAFRQYMRRIGEPRQHRHDGQAAHPLVQAPDDARLTGLQILHLVHQQAERTLPAVRRKHLYERAESACANAAAAGLRRWEQLCPAGIKTSGYGPRDTVRLGQVLQIDREDMRRPRAGLRPFLLQMGEQGGFAGSRRALDQAGGACGPLPGLRVPQRPRQSALYVFYFASTANEERRALAVRRLAEEAQPVEVRSAVRHRRLSLRPPGRPQRRMRKSFCPERSSPRMRKSVRSAWFTRPLSRARPAAIPRSNTEEVGM